MSSQELRSIKGQPEEIEYVWSMAPEKSFSQRLSNVETALKNLPRGENVARAAAPALAIIPVQENILKRHPYLVGLCALIVATLGLVFGTGIGPKILGMWADTRIDEKLKEPNRRIKKIEDGVMASNAKLDLIYDLWKDQLKKAAQLKPTDFGSRLPQTTDALKAATILNIPLPTEVRTSIKEKLLATNSNAPGYWPAVSQFITYRFQPGNPAENLMSRRLMNCYERPAFDSKTFKPYTYNDCAIVLDDPAPQWLEDYMAIVRRDYEEFGDPKVPNPESFLFRNCVVKYSGGQIPKALAGVQFQDCVFIFSINQEPKKQGKELADVLLKATSPTVRIPRPAG